jgi:hypothetical protein
MMFALVKCAFCLVAATAAASAFAIDTYPEIRPLDARYTYYKRAADLDPVYVQKNQIGFFKDYNSFLLLKPVPESAPVVGRVVQFVDGEAPNPRNIVLTVNGKLFYVQTDLAAMGERVTMVRRWNKDDNGIFLIFRGFRAGASPRELMRVTVTLRIATTAGSVLPAIEYYEDAG